jgi:uncharacterized membrane protein
MACQLIVAIVALDCWRRRLRTARDILDERYACSEIDSDADMRAGMVSLRAQVSAERDR